MTHAEIMAMPAGPEMDMVVMEKFFGWSDIKESPINGRLLGMPPGARHPRDAKEVSRLSTDHAASPPTTPPLAAPSVSEGFTRIAIGQPRPAKPGRGILAYQVEVLFTDTEQIESAYWDGKQFLDISHKQVCPACWRIPVPPKEVPAPGAIPQRPSCTCKKGMSDHCDLHNPFSEWNVMREAHKAPAEVPDAA